MTHERRTCQGSPGENLDVISTDVAYPVFTAVQIRCASVTTPSE